MKAILGEYKVLAVILAIVIAALAYFFWGRNKETAPEFITISRKTVLQEVSVTGRVKPASSVDLAFERSGRIARVNTDIGKTVSAGNVLVSLENADILAELSQAEANLEAEEIQLAELKKGTRPEEVAISRAKKSSAETALIDAKNNLTDKIKDAYTKSDDAVRNKIDQFFDNSLSSDPRLSSSLNADAPLEQKTENARVSQETILKSWKISLGTLSILSDLDAYISEAKKNLNGIVMFLDLAASVVNSASSNANLTQTTLDGWRADTATGRANVNTALSNLSTAEEKLRTAESNLLIAERELELKESGATPEEISAEEAKVKSLSAAVDQKHAQLSKTFIVSPINGIVTKMDARQGEIVPANTKLVSVISSARLELEANIPEADVAKLKVGNIANIVLDAYGEDMPFEAKVISIEPAETIVEGVATYKTKFAFLQDDDRVKPGMTADITVFTDKRENVLAVPARALINRDSKKFVKILTANGTEERQVSTGLRGSDGNVEVLEGLTEGDKIIISL